VTWGGASHLVLDLGDVAHVPVVHEVGAELLGVRSQPAARSRLPPLRELGVDHGALQDLVLLLRLEGAGDRFSVIKGIEVIGKDWRQTKLRSIEDQD